MLDQHLRLCDKCRLEQAIWVKYEHKMTHFYSAHRLDESFVSQIREKVASAQMEFPDKPRPEISGRVNALALRWLQPVGLAAGLILATLLFALRSGPSIGRLLEWKRVYP